MEDGFEDHAPSPKDIENPSTPSDLELLKQELESLSPLSSECCIYRVPERLRVVNEKAYTPQVVSIGPLHHGEERLKPMEEHKKRYLRDFLGRTNVGLEEYMKIIKGKEEELRNCYAEPIGFKSDEFAKIVLVDAAFIIEVLLRYFFRQFRDEHDRIFNKPWMIHDIRPDMQLLENQLPFFILEDLFEPIRRNSDLTIIKLSHIFFKQQTFFKGTENNLELISSSRVSCLHFVDLLRNFHVPLEPKSGQGKVKTSNIPSITELRQSGVKFKVRSSKNLLDIHFSQGILEIPKLPVYDDTEIIIRNIIAFEQCHCTEKYTTAYSVIMDNLVNTREDVDLLVKYGIVENLVGDCKQVATLINKLCDGVKWDSNHFFYAAIFEELHDYCGTSWHKWNANMRQMDKGNMKSNDHAPSDIENQSSTLVVSLRKELESLSPISSVCCIYRVPERLRLANEKVYTPQVVSIGPLHHGKEALKAMEEHKMMCLRHFLQRTNVSLEHYINIIRAKEAMLRSSYAEPIELHSDEFVKMVLVDAAFVMEILLRNWFDEFEDQHDRVFNKPWMLQSIFPDLWLLENQLPFFILEDVLLTVSSGDTERLSITNLSRNLFNGLSYTEGESDMLENIHSTKLLHFVDFLRKLWVPILNKDLHAGGKLKTLNLPSVSELYQYGVKIKLGSKKSVCDIRFSNGVLEIPKVIVGHSAELTARNILAFEQRHCRESYWNDLSVFMNRLISSPKDVDLLVKHGIVENKLGDNIQVSSILNKLADGVIMKPNDFYFAALWEELNVYCRSPWNAWKANLTQNYFNTPWAIVSVIAASLLIVLTSVQAVCSVLSVTTTN